MALKVIILLALVALANARQAPNAAYVEQLFNLDVQTRYSTDVQEDSLLDVPGLIQKYGYPQETHHVVTSDGYILEAHRIPYGRDSHYKPGPRPVVFLFHGLLSSSADFIVLGPGSALGYILADAGYDVWLGNARGNYYSRRHISLDPDSRTNQDFWRFSWDNIGYYDLPAFIDYILEVTGQDALHYVGHSQGGTTFLVLNSLRPEYNSKIISFQGLAPASYFHNNNNSMFATLAPLENILETAAFLLGQGEIFGTSDFIGNSCTAGSVLAPLCDISFINTDSPYINSTLVPLLMAHAPAGASIRQIAHYGQVIRFDAFRRYNYNLITNLATYGRSTPPAYDLSRVTALAYLYYGLSDNEVHHDDLRLLAATLPNTIKLKQIERATFNHFDFIWGIDAKTSVYAYLLESLKDAESRL